MWCTVDWSALGTWITGVAAAFIAWQAYRFGANAGRAQAKADDNRTFAYRLALLTELLAIRQRADAIWDQVETAIRTERPHLVYGALKALAANPSFAMSAWAIESPSIGHIPRAEAAAIARAVAAAGEAERFRLYVANANATGIFELETPEAEAGRLLILSSARSGYRELADSIAVVDGLLKPQVKLT